MHDIMAVQAQQKRKTDSGIAKYFSVLSCPSSGRLGYGSHGNRFWDSPDAMVTLAFAPPPAL